MKRIMTFAVVVLAVWSLELWWFNHPQPEVSARLALQQLDGNIADAARLRQFEAGKDLIPVAAGLVTLLAAWLCFGKQLRAGLHQIKARCFKTSALLLGLVSLMGLTGCITHFMGASGSGANLLLQVPTPGPSAALR